MRLPALLTTTLLVLGTATPASSQTGTRPVEAVIGWVHRSPSVQDVAEDGFHAALRVGLTRGRTVRLLAGVNWTRMPDEDLIRPVFCPQPGNPCPAVQNTIPGLGMVGATLGLETVFRTTGLEFRPSLMVGGYSLYHRADNVPALSLGVELGAGLGLPIGTRERILLEGRWLRLPGRAGDAANGRRVNLGIAFH